jgi:hypothetical protein
MGEIERFEQEPQLWQDVKNADLLAVSSNTRPIAALERGTRNRPDGTTEHYERIEY